MNAAQTGKARLFQSGDHAQNLGLRAVFHLGLEAHDIIERSQCVIAAQLHHGIGFFVRLMGIGEAHGLHRAKAQRFAPALSRASKGIQDKSLTPRENCARLARARVDLRPKTGSAL